MKTRLDRQLIVQLHACCVRSARTLEQIPTGGWTELRGASGAEVLLVAELLLKRLDEALPPLAAGDPFQSRDEVLSQAQPPGAMRFLLSPWVAEWSSGWTFTNLEVRFLRATLSTLARVVEQESRPSPSVLIGLCLDLLTCAQLIERRCYGLAELVRAEAGEPGDLMEDRLWVELPDSPEELTALTGAGRR